MYRLHLIPLTVSLFFHIIVTSTKHIKHMVYVQGTYIPTLPHFGEVNKDDNSPTHDGFAVLLE